MLQRFKPRPTALSRRLRSIHNPRPNSHFPQPSAVRIQRVQLRRKLPSVSSVAMTALAIYVGFILVDSHLARLAKTIDDLPPEESEEEDESLQVPIFALPFTIQKVEPLPYKGSDPEWQRFVKVSKDQVLVRNIRGSVAELARVAVDNSPGLKTKMGGKDIKVSKYWLDITYPSRPPPTYTQKRVEYNEGEGLTIVSRPVDSSVVFRTQRALWPSALATTAWTFGSTLAWQNTLGFLKLFGYEPPLSSSPATKQALANVKRLVDKLESSKSTPDSSSPTAPGSSLSPPPGTTGEGARPGSSTGRHVPSVASTSDSGSLTKDSSTDAPPNLDSKKAASQITYGLGDHVSGPWAACKKTFSKLWKPTPSYPPRGSIRITGPVEISGPKAVAVVEASVWYDPQTHKFDGRTLYLGLKQLTPRQQKPLR